MVDPLNLRFTGTVIPGNGRGKGLGFPTANLAVEDDKPGDGVYSAWVQLACGSWVGATVSVGSNPTFRNVRDRRMECHLHDHERDIYGEKIEVFLVRFLRPMVAFNDAAELIAQTQLDVVESREILASIPHPVTCSLGKK